MEAKCSVFVGVSLDGFIARADGSIDWLEAASRNAAPEDYGFGEFLASVDAIVMGRNTFEQVLSFPEWSYGAKRLIVLSRSLHRPPANAPATVSVSQQAPADLVARLSAEGARHLYVDGGFTVQSFLAAGLIDEITISFLPILIGSGIRLFGPLPGDVHLEHLTTRTYEGGLVKNKYRVKEVPNSQASV
jgi:dihydrofolate reductase